MIVARTNYASVGLGDLDPLWVPDLRHTCPAHQNSSGIGIEIDPFGSGEKVEAYHLFSGCQLFGGDRCQTLTDKINGNAGERKQVGFGAAVPNGFDAGPDGWNGFVDFHNPNTGPAQSPLSLYCRNEGEIWLHINSGKLSGDGTQGTFHFDQQIHKLTPTKYTTFILDIGWSPRDDGYVAVYVDGQMAIEKHCPTLDDCPSNRVYWKQGFYRRPNNGRNGDYYFKDTINWASPNASEALAFYGNVPTQPKLRKLSETATTITLGWDAVPNAYGYRFFAAGNAVSVTFDPSRTQVTFAKGAAEYAVLPLMHGDVMVYTP